MFKRLSLFLVQYRKQIVGIFVLKYFLVESLTGFAASAILQKNAWFMFSIDLARQFGELAILALVITLLPGMMRRLRLEFWWVGILMLFRRQLGIFVYLLALSHYLLIRVIPMISFGLSPFTNLEVFELCGMSALFLMTPMFLTSNNYSVKKMGKWWKRVHSVIYLVVWLIFAHVALQSSFKWAALMGIVGIMEFISWGVFVTMSKFRSGLSLSKNNINY